MLPPGGGPMLARLQTAERELSVHEETSAGETAAVSRRSVVREDLEEVRVELRVAQEEETKTQKRLRQEMERFGLPERMTWRQIRGAAKNRARHDFGRKKEERRQKYLQQLSLIHI